MIEPARNEIQLPLDRLVAPGETRDCAQLELDPEWQELLGLVCKGDHRHALALGVAAFGLQLARYGNTGPISLPIERVEPEGLTRQLVRLEVTDGLSSEEYLLDIERQLAEPSRVAVAAAMPLACSASIVVVRDAAALAVAPQLSGSLQLLLCCATGTAAARLKFDRNELEHATIRRMASHWLTLQRGLASMPASSAKGLELLSGAELQVLRSAGSAPCAAALGPDAVALHEQLAAANPSAPATRYRNQSLTYGALNQLANRLARSLAHKGVVPGDRVAVCLDPCLHSTAVLLALLKARAVYVPLDPNYPLARLEIILADVRPVAILCEPRLPESLTRTGPQRLLLADLLADAVEQSATNLGLSPQPQDPAYIFYTSGTTGSPKGVLATRANLTHYVSVARDRYGLCSSDVMPALARFSFSISLFELLAPLCSGASNIVVDRDQVLDVAQLAALLQRVSIFHAGPSLLKGLISHLDLRANTGFDFDRVRHASSGGDMVPPELLEHLKRVFRCAEVFVIYGCSEISVMGCTYEVPRQVQLKRTYVGRAFSGTAFRVLDPDRRMTAIGVAGEVHFCGNGVVDGYLNRPELTTDKFVMIDGQRFYNTGDIGRVSEDGFLQLLGRRDFQVQLRGMRVELGEVEFALRRATGIRDGVVAAHVGVDGETQLVAYYVADAHADIQTGRKPALRSDLRRYLQSQLPDYMVPTNYIELDRLPLNTNLKLDRKALPAPSPVNIEEEPVAPDELPMTPTEVVLGRLWQELLGLQQIGVDSDFFELGGHSLLVMRMLARLRSDLQVDVPLRLLFEHTTIRALGVALDSGTHASDPINIAAIPTLSRAARSAALPLSAAQERMWFWSELAPDTALYNVPISVHLSGTLDIAALQQALNALMQRHEILRTQLLVEAGRPMQRVVPNAVWPLAVQQTDTTAPVESGNRVEALAEAEALRPFDLARELPVRALLIRVADGPDLLTLTLHHSVCDGWSTEIVLTDLFALYERLCSGAPAALPVMPLQYLDFAAWEQHLLASGLRARELDFWRTTLAEAPYTLDLPTDRRRPATQRFRGALHPVTYSAAEVNALRVLGKRHGATLFMVLLAAWQTLLHRLSGQDDVVTGSVTANRDRNELDPIVGYFANSVALRTQFTAGQSVRELLAAVRAAALAAYDNQHVPFEEVVESLAIPRDPSRMPLIQTFIELQPAATQVRRSGAVTATRATLNAPVAKFDLAIELQERGEELYGFFEYDRDLFDAGTIMRWEGHLRHLIAALCAGDDQLVTSLSLLSVNEQTELIERWNQTARPYDNHTPHYRRFERQAALVPDAVAVWAEDKCVSYGELNRRSNQLARYLVEHGVGPGVPVGVCMERSFELVIAVLAAFKSGGSYCPLDPDLPEPRLAFVLRDAQGPVLLTQEHLRTKLCNLLPAGTSMLPVDVSATAWQSLPETNGLHTASPDDVAYIVYTSGSTGQPKGVEVPHRGLSNHITWMAEVMGVIPADRLLQKTTISFDAAISDFLLPLQVGARIVLAAPGGHRDLGYLLELVQHTDVSLCQFVPSQLRVLLDEPRLAECRSLRYVVVGGEALDWTTAKQLRQRLPWVQLGNFYGPSEAADDSTHYPLSGDCDSAGIVPIGLPIANVRCLILDKQQQLVPIGVAGELVVGGVNVAKGYRNQPNLTAEKFIRSPFDLTMKLYRTGDIVRRRADGVIDYLGRIDQQVKLRGFRIELAEIEAAILSSAPTAQCVVLIRQNANDEQSLVAYLAGPPGLATTLKPALSSQLPDYMVPRYYVELPELPRLPNGKLDRKRLPAPQDTDSARSRVAPRNATEELVAAAFSEVLKIDDVSVHDNFFDLGGHSLMAARLVAALRARAKVTLALRSLFEHPTVEALATVVDASRWIARATEPVHSAGGRDEFEV